MPHFAREAREARDDRHPLGVRRRKLRDMLMKGNMKEGAPGDHNDFILKQYLKLALCDPPSSATTVVYLYSICLLASVDGCILLEVAQCDCERRPYFI